MPDSCTQGEVLTRIMSSSIVVWLFVTSLWLFGQTIAAAQPYDDSESKVGRGFQYYKTAGTILGAAPSQTVLPVVPSYAAEFLPKLVDGIAVCNIKSGLCKLVAWTKFVNTNPPKWRSRIELLAIEPEKPARRVWHSEEEDFYDPRIEAAQDWHMGEDPVIMVMRRAGAAAMIVDPLILRNEKVISLKRLLADYASIEQLNGPEHGHQLVLHSRPENQPLDIPIVFEWNGEEFCDRSKEYPELYDSLVQENYFLLSSKDAAASSRYGVAILLELAGRHAEAISTLETLLTELESSKPPKDSALLHHIRMRLAPL